MGRNKTPGPDGYTTEFFETSWQVVGPQVVSAVQHFFKSGFMIKMAVNRTYFRFHPGCKVMQITHLIYVDDLLLFSKCDVKSIELLFDTFHEFSACSGLALNREKSQILFGGCPESLKNFVLDFVSIKEEELPFK